MTQESTRLSRLLGIPPHLMTKPLSAALHTNASFKLIEESRPVLANKLREREIHAALLSPLDYAKDSSDYCIIPNTGVVSPLGNASVVVRFRDGLRLPKTLAVDPAFASEIVLAKIVLGEAFEIEPAILPMNASVDVMMQKADAALLVGDTAFREAAKTDNVIDVSEEWFQMTGLPFVHALWCGRADDLTKEEVQLIQESSLKGVAGIPDLALSFPKEEREGVEQYLESFSYVMDNEAIDGLVEFMKYLYYHTILPDVPELNFYKTAAEEEDDLLSDISTN